MQSSERPFVFVNMAMTVDGKITSAAREQPAFASREDRRRMDQLRASADALLVAAGTVRADNPAWHVRTEAERRGPAPHRLLVSGSAMIPDDSRFFNTEYGGKSIVATTESADAAAVQRLQQRDVELWTLGERRVDLAALLSRCKREGIDRILVEGGGELNWQLFDGDHVDELYVTITPCLLGGRTAPTLLEGDGWAMAQQRRLRLVDVSRVEDEMFCRYAVKRAALCDDGS
jgi:2,5-diamino-6-(ribosylamino)-4(3H)-pyrimidinone 5'-phosphate reductase